MTERLADHCGRLLAGLADRDKRIVALDGDLADSDGACHFALRHPSRFFMAGIAEQNMVSMAAGMATCGLRPFAFSFAAFLCYRAFDQIRISVSHTRQPVALIGSHSGGCTSRNGKTHAALNDIGMMTSLPHMQVWSPADAKDVSLALTNSLSGDSPVYIRTPRRPLDDLDGSAAAYRIFGSPQGIAIVATGLSTHLCLAASAILNNRGRSAFVLHVAQLAPLPALDLFEILSNSNSVFVVEDHSEYGGLAGAIRHLNSSLDVRSIGWPMMWAGESGDDESLLQAYALDATGIAETITAASLSRNAAGR